MLLKQQVEIEMICVGTAGVGLYQQYWIVYKTVTSRANYFSVPGYVVGYSEVVAR